MTERHSQVIEEYLLTLYQTEHSEEGLKAVALAERLKVSPPTVHSTLSRMQRDGLIESGASKVWKLTRQGRSFAEDIAYRHNLAEYFLCHTLGIPWYEVHKHAHQLEHAMTPLVVQKLAEFLGRPEFCPHGTPMPGNSLPQNAYLLVEAEVGANVEITMISESLEDSEELLKVLHRDHITPGEVHQVSAREEVMSTLTLESPHGQVLLPFHIAEHITVVPFL